MAMEMTHERLTLGSGFDELTEQEHLRRYEYVSRFVSGKDVLDVACGSGYGSHSLARAGARSVLGVDVSPEAVEFARARYAHHGLRFAAGDAQDLSGVAGESFDVVVSFETIEHLADVEKYLAEVHRVLKPGGMYVVSTPDRRLASTMYPLRGRPNNQYHIREFTRAELLDLLRRRFEIQECLGQAFIGRWLVFWPLQVLLKGAGYALRRLGGYRLIRKLYHVGSGMDVQADGPGVARFWVVRCTKARG